MGTASQAVGMIRHVVQDHGDADTVIGRPVRLEGIVWFGRLLGWEWPPSYLEVLGKHDGVSVLCGTLASGTIARSDGESKKLPGDR